MAKAIEQLQSGLTVGHAHLGVHGAGPGSVAQQVHDGDTIIVEPAGNLSIRFLGVDTPEVSLMFPGTKSFISIRNARWASLLADPFGTSDPSIPPMPVDFDPGLKAHLLGRVGSTTAQNHADLGDDAHKALEQLVSADLAALGQDEDSFEFFLAFASEVMDRYGRMLCYANRAQPSATSPAPRPPSYNERMLELGWAAPFFIWPNINPFRKASSPVAAVPAPNGASALANSESTLRSARQSVAAARAAHIGLYQVGKELQLEPFELRYLAGRRKPDRWVIDLSKNDDVLVRPHNYYTIANPEDRLFIPAEFVPLFVDTGWQRQA